MSDDKKNPEAQDGVDTWLGLGPRNAGPPPLDASAEADPELEARLDEAGKTVSAEEFALSRAGKKVRVVRKGDLVKLIRDLFQQHGGHLSPERLEELKAQLGLADKTRAADEASAKARALASQLAATDARARELEADLRESEEGRAAAEAKLAGAGDAIDRVAALEKELEQVRVDRDALQRTVDSSPTLERVQDLERLVGLMRSKMRELELALDHFDLVDPSDDDAVQAGLEVARGAASGGALGQIAAAVAGDVEESHARWKKLRERMEAGKGTAEVVAGALRAQLAVAHGLDAIDVVRRAHEGR